MIHMYRASAFQNKLKILKKNFKSVNMQVQPYSIPLKGCCPSDRNIYKCTPSIANTQTIMQYLQKFKNIYKYFQIFTNIYKYLQKFTNALLILPIHKRLYRRRPIGVFAKWKSHFENQYINIFIGPSVPGVRSMGPVLVMSLREVLQT